MNLKSVLASHHVGIGEDEFLSELDLALSSAGDPAVTPLSQSESEFLRAHAGQGADSDALDRTPDGASDSSLSARFTRNFMTTVTESLSIEEAAKELGVSRSRVSQLTSNGQLWSFTLGNHKRIPRWQFIAGQRLPGLSAVIAAIPHGLSPDNLAGLLGTPQAELDGATPYSWLAGGGDPGIVAELLRGLAQW